jgi:membrane protein DedA with SNARE-associated domain
MPASHELVYLAGALQAAVIAVGAYLVQPNDPTGRPLLIAVLGVALSAVVSYLTGRKVKAAVAREIEQSKAHP